MKNTEESPLNLYHCITGLGFPLALQGSSTFSPDRTSLSKGFCNQSGGTEMNEKSEFQNYTENVNSHSIIRKMQEKIINYSSIYLNIYKIKIIVVLFIYVFTKKIK